MHAQEGFLAEILGVFGVSHHAMNHMPAQPLILAHEILKSARPAIQDGIDKGLILGMADEECAHTLLDTPMT